MKTINPIEKEPTALHCNDCWCHLDFIAETGKYYCPCCGNEYWPDELDDYYANDEPIISQ